MDQASPPLNSPDIESLETARRVLRLEAAALDARFGEAVRLLAAEALRLMNEGGITTPFVVDARRRPAGIPHIHDLLRAGVA